MTTKCASSIVLLVGVTLALCACGSKPGAISVGSRNNTESLIIGEIVAAHLEKQLPGVKIERKLGLGGPMVVQGAVQSGAIDLFAEDAGTMLGAILKEDVPSDELVAVSRARAQYQALYKLSVLNPLGFHHKLVVLSHLSGASGIKSDTLTALGNMGASFRLGFAYDLFDRKDAYTVLATTYKITARELPQRMEPRAMYEALKNSIIDLAGGYSTDSWTDQPGFHILKDDQDLFPAHAVCLVVRNQALASHPDLERILQALSGSIKDDAMRSMNQQVDLKHLKPADVARTFLVTAGF